MSPFLIYTLALAAVLFVVFRRLARPRSSWEAFRHEAQQRAQTTRKELLRANEAISDAEALQPVLAALADMPLPEGVTLRIRADAPGQAWVEVTWESTSYMLHLAHGRYRSSGQAFTSAGCWTVEVHPLASLATKKPTQKTGWKREEPISTQRLQSIAFNDMNNYMIYLAKILKNKFSCQLPKIL